MTPALAQADPLTPSAVLNQVYEKNPEIAASKARYESEEAAVRSSYSLSNPRFGLMRETNMTADQRQMGFMQSWQVSQEILFPTKYFSMGSVQKSRAESAKQGYLDKQLVVRQMALTQYYNFYVTSKILTLLEAQKETLRELARIAEARRATGAVPQQDEMRAHVEQTKIENELLLQQQEIIEARAKLNALLNRDPDIEITLPKEDLSTPKITFSKKDLQSLSLQNSKLISVQAALLESAEAERTLAYTQYLPDFMLSYRKPFGPNAPDNAYAIGIEMSIPLWFFMKQTSESSAASLRAIESEKQLELVRRSVQSETSTLISRTETLSKLLKIYETALIPQATSALNSSTAAYRGGKAGFQDLLDAERSLYSVRIDYFRNLAKYVESLTSLERLVGQLLSDLPMEGASVKQAANEGPNESEPAEGIKET